MYALRAHRAAAGGAPPEPLSAVAGMDALQLNIALKGFFAAVARPRPPPPPPPPFVLSGHAASLTRTNRTRLVPHPVLIGLPARPRVLRSSLSPCAPPAPRAARPAPQQHRSTPPPPPSTTHIAPPVRRADGARARAFRTDRTRRVHPPVLTGHAASIGALFLARDAARRAHHAPAAAPRRARAGSARGCRELHGAVRSCHGPNGQVAACPRVPARGTRRVRLVRGEGRGVST